MSVFASICRGQRINGRRWWTARHLRVVCWRLMAVSAMMAAIPAMRASDDVPGWFREAATRRIPAYDAKVPATVLLDEFHASVDATGHITLSERKAVKILSREGRNQAVAWHVYLAGTAKFREMRAWLLSPSGDPLKLAKENEYDRASTMGDMYNDVRVRGIDARAKADAGTVFGFEWISEETPLFAQFEYYFQSRLPALVSRYVLTVPAGWRAEGTVYNHAAVAPGVDGSTYTWELRDLPFLEPEPASPNTDSLCPRLAVSYFPAAESKQQRASAFPDWQTVARWIAGLADPQAVPDDAIKLKAQTLTANARDEFQKIQLLGAFVQRIKYVSIQTGMGRGGGYRPHAASSIFQTEYGDCKDKATLLRALLSSAGITSYMVGVNSYDRSYVREGWPSPQQFNHAIVAVKVSPDVKAPAVVDDPVLGRLLFFDPTNAVTPPGELPVYEQGSLVLPAAAQSTKLIRLPMSTPSANLLARETRAVLMDNGTLQAEIRDDARGVAAASDRALNNSLQPAQFHENIERWVAHGAIAAVVTRVEPRDYFFQGRFGLTVAFSAPGYAQLKSNRLLVFRPVMVGRRDSVYLTDKERHEPVLLTPSALREVVHIKLPTGFKVDEMPDPAKLQTPFGQYSETCELVNGEIVFTRSMEVSAATIPAEQYGAVRDFYQRILDAEQAPVVLARQ